jgi:hypothetical protein
LTVADEAIASIARVTRASLPALFVVLYAGSLVLLAFGAIALGRIYFRTQMATLTLFAGLTMRHAIARTGTNTLEGYFHPRQLAFALGAWAVVNFLRGRDVRATLFIVAAGLVHPTTALWYAVWLAVAFVASIAGGRARRLQPLVAAHRRLGADGGATAGGLTGWIRSGWRPFCRRTTSSLSSGRGRCG